MNIEELREYNKLVIDASKEVCRPWKWTTAIISFLLIAMVALYFFCPANVLIEQDFNGENSVGTTNNQKG